MPLVAGPLYWLMPFEDARDTGSPRREPEVETPQPRAAEVVAQPPREAGSTIAAVAPLVLLGLLGYVFVLLIRSFDLSRRP